MILVVFPIFVQQRIDTSRKKEAYYASGINVSKIRTHFLKTIYWDRLPREIVAHIFLEVFNK